MVEQKRLDLFTTPVLKAVFPDYQSANRHLLQTIASKRAEDPTGIDRSNQGGWHSNIDMLTWGGSEAARLAEFATSLCAPHLADIHAGGKRDFRFVCDMWTNINPPGAQNAYHCHPGAVWAGVYYVDNGGREGPGGELMLQDPRFPMAYMTVPDLVMRDGAGEPARATYSVAPKPGVLVMFPGWLGHSVRPHKGHRERVSIALNLMLQPAT
ncbi:MAG: TIGR02466 family protein [Pseudomonadota bacterium]